ncbi:hypothetical protein [Porphyromonas sp. oral taxon 275]|uniref:phage head completion protein n=1 Tax=Porphyromonas sp. oral taxon 275 TaxID=712435 RepID=UPI001BAD7087|nr:hypothetical protein [Porphyromonas sp. oral taxon 275]QUB43850.1 hypothetical protein J4862_04335 [Porphyromonas sp. oral taxon 275]
MNAGAFIHKLDFYGHVRSQSLSGAVREQRAFLFSARGWLKSQRQSYDKDGLMAREEFSGATLVMVVRQDRRLDHVRWVLWRDQLFEVIMRTPQIDRTEMLYLVKRDE